MVVEQEEDPRASAPTDAEADAAGERLRVQLEQHALMVDNQLVELQAAAAEQEAAAALREQALEDKLSDYELVFGDAMKKAM